ncbi:hypothetical protein M405DRAFT_504219 [Rhizopogon salebrosus TDB-379]|nr:hypothetical protein M405DRAFT_504219 [Rhizopogon salebrosus TDB-379]
MQLICRLIIRLGVRYKSRWTRFDASIDFLSVVLVKLFVRSLQHVKIQVMPVLVSSTLSGTTLLPVIIIIVARLYAKCFAH